MLELFKERNLALIETIERLQAQDKSCRRLPLNKVIEQAVKCEAPGYFITFETAIKGLRQYRKGRFPPEFNPLKRQMWAEIAEKVDKVRRSLKINRDTEALALVLAGGRASRFFISAKYATRLLQLLNYENKNIYNNSRNRYYHNGVQHSKTSHQIGRAD